MKKRPGLAHLKNIFKLLNVVTILPWAKLPCLISDWDPWRDNAGGNRWSLWTTCAASPALAAQTSGSWATPSSGTSRGKEAPSGKGKSLFNSLNQAGIRTWDLPNDHVPSWTSCHFFKSCYLFVLWTHTKSCGQW